MLLSEQEPEKNRSLIHIKLHGVPLFEGNLFPDGRKSKLSGASCALCIPFNPIQDCRDIMGLIMGYDYLV